MIRFLVFLLLSVFLPLTTFAQTVNVGGFVPSKVDPNNSTVVASPTSLPADGISTSVVTVTLRDSSNGLLANIEVTLTSSRGGIDTIGHYVGTTFTPGNSYTTNASGVVKFGVRSVTVGTSKLTAIAESLVTLTQKPDIVFTQVGGGGPPEADPNTSSVVADPLSVPANNSSLTIITVTLRAANNSVLPNRTVAVNSNRLEDYVGHYEGENLVDGNYFATDSNGIVKFGSRSALVGDATYTATTISVSSLVESLITLADQPVVNFFTPSPGGGTGGEPPPGEEPPPTEREETPIEKVIKFIRERATETTNNNLAGLGAITTIALLPTLTTSIITAILQNIPFLNFLLTSWLPIRKRKKWGTVRDITTGVPVAGVQVELFKVGGTAPELKYRTDQTGQYGFLVKETSNYFLSITSPLYLDYKSPVLPISNIEQIVSLDIALSPNVAEQTTRVTTARRYLDWIYYFNYFSVIMVSVGTIVSLFVYYTDPTTPSALVLALYAIIWSFKLYHYIRYRHYGLVVDSDSSAKIPAAIIQLTGERQGIQALIHSTITDSRGRFLFVVKPARYSLIAAKEGYYPSEMELKESRLGSTINLQKLPNPVSSTKLA